MTTELQHTLADATLLCESPGNSGTLSISQPEMGGAWRADRERWLYLQLDFPGGRTLGWQSQVVLDAAFAQPPAPGLPEPDLRWRSSRLATRTKRACGSADEDERRAGRRGAD